MESAIFVVLFLSCGAFLRVPCAVWRLLLLLLLLL